MNTRATVILGAAAVVILVLGLTFGLGNREQQAEAPAGQLAFPGLAPKLADAATIEVSQGGKTLHVARKGENWTLPDKGGYPAQSTRAHELLTGLAELKLAEPRTSNPDEYSRLGVQESPKEAPKDPPKDPKDSGATLVRVLDGSGAAIAQMLVGHSHIGSGGSGDGVYVRRPGEAQAWLAEGRVTADTDAMEWLDKDIASFPGDKITGITVTRGAQTLIFARKDGKMALQAPAEHPNLDQFKLDDIGRALDNLTLDDVKPVPAPGTAVGQSAFTTGDGVTVTANVTKDGADIWAVFGATGDDKGKAAADALNAKLKGWAYKLGSWKEAALVPTLDDLKAYQPPPAAAGKLPAATAVPDVEPPEPK